jgi:hypothetical protein
MPRIIAPASSSPRHHHRENLRSLKLTLPRQALVKAEAIKI